MRVIVNGQTQAVPDGVTVDAVARTLLDRPRGVAVALNGEVVPRSTWAQVRLAEDDRIEVLTARQGG